MFVNIGGERDVFDWVSQVDWLVADIEIHSGKARSGDLGLPANRANSQGKPRRYKTPKYAILQSNQSLKRFWCLVVIQRRVMLLEMTTVQKEI